MGGLVTANCVAEALGIDLCACDETDAATLARFVAAANREAEYCAGRELCARNDIVECIEPGCTEEITLSHAPLLKIHSVECAHCGQIDDYCIDSLDPAIISRCCGWPKCGCPRKSIKVTYAAGYITEELRSEIGGPFEGCDVTLPPDLECAICDLAMAKWQMRCVAPGVKSVKNLSASITYESDARHPNSSLSVFKRYRRGCF